MCSFLDDAAFTNCGLKYRNLRILVFCFRLPHMVRSSIFSDFHHGGSETSMNKHEFSQLLVGVSEPKHHGRSA